MASERQEGGRSGCLLIKHSHCTVKNRPASPAAACGERIDHTLPLGEGPSFSFPPFAFSTPWASIYIAQSFDDHGSSPSLLPASITRGAKCLSPCFASTSTDDALHRRANGAFTQPTETNPARWQRDLYRKLAAHWKKRKEN